MFLLLLLIIIAAIVAAVALHVVRQGDAAFAFLVEQHGPWRVERSGDVLTARTVVPFVNRGRQDGTLMDVFPRCQVPQEYYDGACVTATITNEAAPRTDGYWEAFIVPTGASGAVVLTVQFAARRDLSAVLAELVDFPIDIIYQVVARGPWYLAKARLLVSAAAIRQAWQEQAEQGGNG